MHRAFLHSLLVGSQESEASSLLLFCAQLFHQGRQLVQPVVHGVQLGVDFLVVLTQGFVVAAQLLDRPHKDDPALEPVSPFGIQGEGHPGIHHVLSAPEAAAHIEADAFRRLIEGPDGRRVGAPVMAEAGGKIQLVFRIEFQRMEGRQSRGAGPHRSTRLSRRVMALFTPLTTPPSWLTFTASVGLVPGATS